MLFLSVTAEEQGLLGSEYYGNFPLYPLEKTLGVINIDGINQWGKTSDLVVVGLGAPAGVLAGKCHCVGQTRGTVSADHPLEARHEPILGNRRPLRRRDRN